MAIIILLVLLNFYKEIDTPFWKIFFFSPKKTQTWDIFGGGNEGEEFVHFLSAKARIPLLLHLK